MCSRILTHFSIPFGNSGGIWVIWRFVLLSLPSPLCLLEEMCGSLVYVEVSCSPLSHPAASFIKSSTVHPILGGRVTLHMPSFI